MFRWLGSIFGFDAARYNDWNVVFLAPWGRFAYSAAIFVACLTLIWTAMGARREPLWRYRIGIVFLRTLAVLGALILFVQPAIELRHVTRQPNHIAVLVDDSRSMSIADREGGPTRLSRAQKLIENSAATFAAWRSRHDIDFFTFSDTLLPMTEESLATKVLPRGDATSMREALAALQTRYEGHELGGVVLISDGIATGRFAAVGNSGFDLDSKEFLQTLGVRIHTVLSTEDGLTDVAIARVAVDDFAFVRTALKIEVAVQISGLSLSSLPLTLTRDGNIVQTLTATVDPATGEAKATFEFSPEAVGKFLYTVATPVVSGESIATNNSRSFVLRVIRDKIRVVQVAGRPSWDERKLRGLLKRDPNVDLVSFFILRTPSDLFRVPEDEMSLIPFPTQELFEQELPGFDVLIMQDFNYGPYGLGGYLNNIKSFVEGGGALVMTGGDNSFTGGSYGMTPIADILPLELLAENTPTEKWINIDPFKLALTSDGERHPVTQLKLDARENSERWRALPELAGTNVVAGAKPGATVLGTHPLLKGRDGKPMPVLAVTEAKKGRVLALTTDASWYWGFLSAGEGDDGRAYDKFWQNAIRWLIHDPELRLLRVSTDRPEYVAGDNVQIDAELLGSDYRPRKGVSVTIEVVRSEEGPAAGLAAPRKAIATKALVTDEQGEVHTDLPIVTEGAYRVYAKVASLPGAAAASAPIVPQLEDADVFLVRKVGQELSDPKPRPSLLERLSKETGGVYLKNSDKLPLDLAFAPPRVVRIDHRSDVPVWSSQSVFWFVIAMLVIEWILRRRRGFL